MGRHTDLAVIGSRRAAVATLTASVLLVGGGIAILRAAAGDVRIGPTQPRSPSVTATTPSTPPTTLPTTLSTTLSTTPAAPTG
jgi:hypothetical protein